MTEPLGGVKFGADCFSQHTSWHDYAEAMRWVEELVRQGDHGAPHR